VPSFSHLFALFDASIGVENEMNHSVPDDELRIHVDELLLLRVVVNVIHEAT